MPRNMTKRVNRRMSDIVSLIGKHGCLSTSAIQQGLGLTHTNVFYALQGLVETGAVSKIPVGSLAIWCTDCETAKKYLAPAFELVHKLICENGLKYAWPSRVAKLAEEARALKVFRQYVPNVASTRGYTPRLLSFIDGILNMMYQKARSVRRHRIYHVKCDGEVEPRIECNNVHTNVDGDDGKVELDAYVCNALIETAKKYYNGRTGDLVRSAIDELIRKYSHIQLNGDVETVRVSICVNNETYRQVAKLVEVGMYSTIAEVVRDAARLALTAQLTNDGVEGCRKYIMAMMPKSMIKALSERYQSYPRAIKVGLAMLLKNAEPLMQDLTQHLESGEEVGKG